MTTSLRETISQAAFWRQSLCPNCVQVVEVEEGEGEEPECPECGERRLVPAAGFVSVLRALEAEEEEGG